MPYGDRTPAELLRLMRYNVRWLDEAAVDAIVPACNTSCATALEFGWPQTRAPIVDLIESAAVAVERSHCLRIGVVATTATALSGAYKRHILARVPAAQVLEVGAPRLAPIVEAGDLQSETTALAVAQACAPLHGRIDAVMLGCTHYPLLRRHFEAFFGQAVTVLDPAHVQAERSAELVAQLGLGEENGSLTCVTNGDARRFEAMLQELGAGLDPVMRLLEPVEP